MSTPKPLDVDTDDGGAIVNAEESSLPEIEDTDDGGAIVKVEGQEEQSVSDIQDFYRNLVTDVDDSEISAIASELWIRIERDLEDRKDRDKKYAEGILRTGMGADAPGGADFDGASKVSHPMITKAVVEYSSRSIKELMPAGGPVKTEILGKVTQGRLDKADRKKEYMNFQCTKQMPELRHEIEQGLTQEGLNGSFYLRLVYDPSKRRPVPLGINTDDIVLPYGASSFYTAERVTYREYITESEYKKRVREDIYFDVDLLPSSMVPERSEAAKANEKIEGVTPDPYNQDGLRAIYHVKLNLEIEDTEGPPMPYILQIDHTTKEPLSLVRNWEKEDDTFQAMDWIIEFPFIPWRGPYPVGFIHLIGGLAGAATGALRALLDSSHINNLPTLLKLKGSNLMGQSTELQATGVHEIEGGVAVDDIRKLVMPVPYNPPSVVLYQLLGFLVGEGAEVVRVSMETLADQNVNQMPVGTTLALIEQGLKVLSAIHGRQHAAFARFLGVLHRINRMYLTDEEILDETGEMICYRSDFQGPLDIVPVSDPEIFSDVQRYAQMQIIEQRAMTLPQLYDLRKVEQMILRRTKIPDAEDLLLPAPKTEEMNAVNENVALVMGRPVAAYPDQDHLAHIQILLDFLSSDFLGRLSVVAPTFIGGALNHLKEHIALWYVDFMQKAATKAAGRQITALMQYKDPSTRRELDRLLAAISGDPEGGIVVQSKKAFGGLPAIIQRAQALLQQLQPPGLNVQNTPQVASAQIKAQSDAQERQQKAQIVQIQEAGKAADRQARMQQGTMTQQAEDQRAARDLTAQAAGVQVEQENKAGITQIAQQHEDVRTAATNESKERMNTADNETAKEIAEAEIEAGKKTNISSGSGINP